MSFVRTKEINGQKYDYLVENKRVKGKVIQKVKKYLGKNVSDFERRSEK